MMIIMQIMIIIQSWIGDSDDDHHHSDDDADDEVTNHPSLEVEVKTTRGAGAVHYCCHCRPDNDDDDDDYDEND